LKSISPSLSVLAYISVFPVLFSLSIHIFGAAIVRRFLLMKIKLFLFCWLYLTALGFAQIIPKTYKSLEEALKVPEKVQSLDLGGQKLGVFPVDILKLPNLQKLVLYDNQIKEIPAEIRRLKHLKVIDLYNNQIESLPVEIAELDSLVRLDLGWNRFSEIPSVIFKLKTLKELYLYGNSIKIIPAEITQLTQLESLRLGAGLKFFFGGNKIKSLPDSFGQLTHLKELYLPDNRLRKLPKSFSQLQKLKHLDLNHNRFNQIPLELYPLDSLAYLSIWDKGFGKKAKNQAQTMMPRTRFDFQEDYEGNFWGLVGGFQQGKFSVVEAGIVRAFKKDIITVALGLSGEANLSKEMYGAKLSAWATGLLVFSGGIHAGYYREAAASNVFLRPEIGIGWHLWSLTYGYNILLLKGSESVNRHLIALRLIVPISPIFSIFK
jgi:Leucine-rich repeat (LRR) protein